MSDQQDPRPPQDSTTSIVIAFIVVVIATLAVLLGSGTILPKSSDLLQLLGLALNVIGTALVFFYGYPPTDDAVRQARFVRLARLADPFNSAGKV